MSSRKLAVLGLGKMGSAIANQFVTSGQSVTVWNRTPAKAQAFDGRAQIAASAAVACADSDTIVLSLSNYSAGLEVLDNAADEIRFDGKRLVQLTSGTASDARTMEAWAHMHGMDYLDAAILAYPNAVGSEHPLLLYSGNEAVWAAIREQFSVLGGTHRYVGEAVGGAATYDCAVLEYYYGATLAMLHGAALVDSERAPLSEYFFLVKALSALLSETADSARAMIPREVYSGTDCALDVHVAALRHIQRMSHDNGIDTRIPDTIAQAYKKAVSAGFGDDEIAACFEVLRAPPQTG